MLTTQMILARKINNYIKIQKNDQMKGFHSFKSISTTPNDTVEVIWDIHPHTVLTKSAKKVEILK